MQEETKHHGDRIRVAAVQMVSGPDVAENLAHADHLIGLAAARGARVVCLPEYFCLLGRHDRDKVLIGEAYGDGPLQRWLAGSAAKHGLWLIGGSIPLRTADATRIRNTTLVFDPQGAEKARYDKIHLFSFQKGNERYDESVSIEPGSSPVAFELDDAGVTGRRRPRVALSICYDLRFPELYRQLAPMDLIVVPAAFTYTTGQAHWEVLMRARAIENQCYVLASAQGGEHPNGRRTWGQSMLIDPWGNILESLDQGEGVVVGEIDLSMIDDVRLNLPALRHRVLA